ncbi:MAG: tetratricopeptide repeat protein [Acidobacteriota bacterium]|nr:tetratricopeptide repeat protein [Acidobacteriota bacterium]
MSEWHPYAEDLERFLDDELTASESRAIQRHLLTCPDCEHQLIELLPLATTAPNQEVAANRTAAGNGLRSLVQRMMGETRLDLERRISRMARERVDARELWRQLQDEGPEVRRERLWANPRCQSWGLYELLVEKAKEAVLEEPHKAEDLLRLALDVVDHLDPKVHGPGAVESARTRVWAYLGNAHRVLSDFRRADQAFQTADKYLSGSWFDPLTEALLLELKASLRRAQRRFDEALEMLNEAIALYREIHEPHLQGRTLMTKAMVLQYSGDAEAACSCFRDSLFLLDGNEEPRLVVCSQYNLISCLLDSGRTSEAAVLIPEARRLMEQSGKRLDLLRLRWLEGRIAAARWRPAEAEQAFLEVRDAFIADRLAYDTALVALDLAALYAREGRIGETKTLAREILPIFRSCEVHREALAALIVFQRAADMEQLTLGLVEEIAEFLESARTDPTLSFRNGADRDPQAAAPLASHSSLS